MPYLSFLHFFSTIAYIYLTVFILIKNWKSPLNRICAVVFVCFALWCFGKTATHNPYVSHETALQFMKVVILGAWTFSGFLLCFALIFTDRAHVLKKRWIYFLIFVIPVVAILEQWFNGTILDYVKRPYGWGLQWQKSPLTLPLLGYFFASLVTAVVLILLYVKKAQNPIKRKQAFIVGISTTIGFVIGYPTNIIIPRLSSVPFPDFAHNMALIWAIGLVYAIVKYKFMVITPATAAENIISTMSNALILADPEGRIVTVNRSGRDLLGYEKGELEGKPIQTILSKEDRSTEDTLIHMKVRPLVSEDVFFLSKDNKNIPVSLSTSLLMGEEYTIAGVVCIAKDITDRKIAEQAMKKSKEEAEAANQAKSEFLANMSHELRTPLNHIIGFTELVVDKNFGDLNETQQEYLGDVLQSSRHLLSLINDILDLSKVEAGKVELDISGVSIRTLLENSITMIKEKSLKHGICLKQDFNGIPDIIRADERKLKQVVYNLLSNAAKFTPDGGEIELKANRVNVNDNGGEDKEYIEVSIRDTGIGLIQDDLERIFKAFEQVESNKSRKYQGTGLGLSLTKTLIELHGGKIWAESEGQGKGSTFRFVIPV